MLASIFSPDRVTTSLKGTSKDEVLRSLAKLFVDLDPTEVHRVFHEREQIGTTGFGSGVAIPHGRIAGIDKTVAALGVSRRGVSFDSIDGEPVRIFVAIVSPKGASEHLKVLAHVARVLRDGSIRSLLLEADDAQAHALIASASR